MHLKYSTDEEAAAIHKASQPADSTKHEAMVGIANERIVNYFYKKCNANIISRLMILLLKSLCHTRKFKKAKGM